MPVSRTFHHRRTHRTDPFPAVTPGPTSDYATWCVTTPDMFSVLTLAGPFIVVRCSTTFGPLAVPDTPPARRLQKRLARKASRAEAKAEIAAALVPVPEDDLVDLDALLWDEESIALQHFNARMDAYDHERLRFEDEAHDHLDFYVFEHDDDDVLARSDDEIVAHFGVTTFAELYDALVEATTAQPTHPTAPTGHHTEEILMSAIIDIPDLTRFEHLAGATFDGDDLLDLIPAEVVRDLRRRATGFDVDADTEAYLMGELPVTDDEVELPDEDDGDPFVLGDVDDLDAWSIAELV
jgi:hypothetical protein